MKPTDVMLTTFFLGSAATLARASENLQHDHKSHSDGHSFAFWAILVSSCVGFGCLLCCICLCIATCKSMILPYSPQKQLPQAPAGGDIELAPVPAPKCEYR